MRNILFILSAMAFLIVASCKTKENPEPQKQLGFADIDVVTGINLFDENGNPIGAWNAPNDNRGECVAYPNPAISTVYVFSFDKIARIWLVHTDCLIDSVTMNIPELSKELNYELAEIEDAQIMDIETPNFNNQIAIDFSNYNKGFYKLFYLLDDGELFWQNIFIDPTVSNIPNYDSLDDFCN